MSAPIKLVAVMTLNEGKEARFMELFKKCADYVKENEPFVWAYELSRGRTDPAGEVTDIVCRETYANKEGFDKHMAGENVVALIKAIEAENLVKSSKIIFTENEIIGVSSRL